MSRHQFVLGAATLLVSIVSTSPIERQHSAFTYYDLKTPLAAPCDLTTGPDGNIWADTFLANKIVKVDRKTGELTEYDIPYTLPLLNTTLPSSVQGRIAGACVVQPGKDGNVYAATGLRNQFLRVNVTNGHIDVFDTGNPLGNLQPFNDFWPGETGMFFTQTTANLISIFDYKTEKITSYEVPTMLAGPLGAIVASDGAFWFTEMLANKIGRFDITDGSFREYDLPLSLATPSVMRAETEGRYLFFTAIATNSIGRIDIYTGETKTYTIPALLATPIEDTVDGKGVDTTAGFSTLTQNLLNYVDPLTGEFTTIDQPDATPLTGILPSLPPAADIAMHWVADDNSIWFTEFAFNRIGRYQIPS